MGRKTKSVVLDIFLLFVIQLLWWRCLFQSVTFIQSPTSNALDLYFLPYLSQRHQSGCLQVYLYDLDCVVPWGLPITCNEIFSTLLLYIVTHILATFWKPLIYLLMLLLDLLVTLHHIPIAYSLVSKVDAQYHLQCILEVCCSS